MPAAATRRCAVVVTSKVPQDRPQCPSRRRDALTPISQENGPRYHIAQRDPSSNCQWSLYIHSPGAPSRSVGSWVPRWFSSSLLHHLTRYPYPEVLCTNHPAAFIPLSPTSVAFDPRSDPASSALRILRAITTALRLCGFSRPRRDTAPGASVIMDIFEGKCSDLRDPGFVNLVVSVYVWILASQACHALRDLKGFVSSRSPAFADPETASSSSAC